MNLEEIDMILLKLLLSLYDHSEIQKIQLQIKNKFNSIIYKVKP